MSELLVTSCEFKSRVTKQESKAQVMRYKSKWRIKEFEVVLEQFLCYLDIRY